MGRSPFIGLVLLAGCNAGSAPAAADPEAPPAEEPCDDADSDGACDEADNCPDLANADQADADEDGLGDPCEPTRFRVTVIDAGVVPIKANGSPWDFSGNVPDRLLDLTSLVGVFWPTAQTFAEVLHYTDLIAPELLEGTVPPDAYVRVRLLDASSEIVVGFGSTEPDSDTVEPRWDLSVETGVLPGERLCFDLFDGDIGGDDTIGGVCHTLETLQRTESVGPFDLTPAEVEMGQVFRIGFAVEPLAP